MREAARLEAEAKGEGRRPRAPSRRALEASGRMADQGPQLLTTEVKEELAEASNQVRERRKMSKAAGLKAGMVLEEVVETMPTGAGASDGVGAATVDEQEETAG